MLISRFNKVSMLSGSLRKYPAESGVQSDDLTPDRGEIDNCDRLQSRRTISCKECEFT